MRRRARYAAGGGGGGFGGLGGGGFGGFGGSMRQPIPGYSRRGGGVRPDHATPMGVLRYRSDLHDADDYGTVGEHVEVVAVSFAGRLADARLRKVG